MDHGQLAEGLTALQSPFLSETRVASVDALDDIKVVWHDLEAYHLANQIFADAGVLHRGRFINPLVNQRISA